MEKTTEAPLLTPEDLEILPYDTAEFLDSDEAIAGYLEISLEDPDPDMFLYALGDAIRAKGVENIAKETGLTREALCRACQSDKKPDFDFETILKITRALGVPLGFPSREAAPKKPASKKPARPRSASRPRRKREAVTA